MSVTRQKSVQKEKVYLSHCVMRFKFLHSQSWLWQKSVQKEKFDLLHFVVRLCTPNADLDRNLFKKKNLSFTLCGEIFAHLDGNLCKKKKLIFFTLCGEILQSQSWPWRKSVQKEKFDLLHCVVRFCTPNADLALVDFHSCLQLVWTPMTPVCGTD